MCGIVSVASLPLLILDSDDAAHGTSLGRLLQADLVLLLAVQLVAWSLDSGPSWIIALGPLGTMAKTWIDDVQRDSEPRLQFTSRAAAHVMLPLLLQVPALRRSRHTKQDLTELIRQATSQELFATIQIFVGAFLVVVGLHPPPVRQETTSRATWALRGGAFVACVNLNVAAAWAWYLASR